MDIAGMLPTLGGTPLPEAEGVFSVFWSLPAASGLPQRWHALIH